MQRVQDFKIIDRKENTMLPWLVCFSATLIFFYEFIQGNMFASLADNIMRDFHIGVREMAYLSSVYYLANVLFLPFAGMILDRFSIRKTILAAMVLTVGSTFIFAHVQSYSIAMLCRFLMGIGSGFCFLGPVRLAAQWFPPRRMALVTGLIVTMAMAGGWVAQFPMTWLIENQGWRHVVTELGYAGIIMLVIMVLFIQEKPQAANDPQPSEHSVFATLKTAYLNFRNTRAALYTSLMNMVIAVLGAMMGKLYLEQRLGIDPQQASWINSMLFVGAIIGGPLMGFMSDKIGQRIMPMKIGALASLATIIAVLYLPVTPHMMMGLFFLLGLFTSSQIISYAYVAENNSPAITATALSLISILTQGGYLVYQNLFSWLLESHGTSTIVDGVTHYPLSSYQYASSIFVYGLIIACLVTFKLPDTLKKN